MNGWSPLHGVILSTVGALLVVAGLSTTEPLAIAAGAFVAVIGIVTSGDPA